ncbi:competence protein ComEA [Lysobacter oculi]|uniref:Competence protein ComEA n=1 Tax=Solilutibacter oculi TaxID=2698682 RepID=A0A344J6B1_9GAMM|nr:helix-hairpin-helix domain-containing protein [Lysobacter oculi]AXA84571.1 competence protein ComEA [Lysobacter oculi]
MKRSLAFISSLLLSLLLCGSALAAEVVNINTADAAALDAAMVNVGPAKAQAIVEYRRENGAFKSVEELALVKGIGLRTIERNRDRLTIGNGKAMQPARAKPAAPAAAPRR